MTEKNTCILLEGYNPDSPRTSFKFSKTPPLVTLHRGVRLERIRVDGFVVQGLPYSFITPSELEKWIKVFNEYLAYIRQNSQSYVPLHGVMNAKAVMSGRTSVKAQDALDALMEIKLGVWIYYSRFWEMFNGNNIMKSYKFVFMESDMSGFYCIP